MKNLLLPQIKAKVIHTAEDDHGMTTIEMMYVNQTLPQFFRLTIPTDIARTMNLQYEDVIVWTPTPELRRN